MIEMRTLGRTGEKISVLSYGAMRFQGMGEAEIGSLLNAVLDSGINYIDTAPEYEGSEEAIGSHISGRRNEYFLATKCGDGLLPNGPTIVYTKEVFLSNLERSLRLLKTDRIDLWQMHGLQPHHLPGGEMDELVQIMLDAKKAGKIRYIGASFRNGKKTEDRYPDGFGFDAANFFKDWMVFDSFMIVYGALARKSESVIGELSSRGKGIIARGSIRKYKPDFNELYEKAGLRELANPAEDANSFLIRYTLSHPDLASVLIGTSKLNHLEANLASAHIGPLDEGTYREAKKRLAALGIVPG